MDSTTYERWWSLHLRVARGEALPPEEQVAYEVGRRQLEQAEALGDPREQARAAAAAVAALQAEHAKLQARRTEVEAEIARLEHALGEPVRQFLGAEK
jgi:hypothetical protein